MLLSMQNYEFFHRGLAPKWSGTGATMSAYFYSEVTDLCHTDIAFLHPPPWPGQKGIGGPILSCGKDVTNTSLPPNMCLHWTKCGCLWGSDMGRTRLRRLGSFSGTSADFCSSLDELIYLAELRWIFGGCSLRFGSCRVDIAAAKRIRTHPQPNSNQSMLSLMFCPILGQVSTEKIIIMHTQEHIPWPDWEDISIWL